VVLNGEKYIRHCLNSLKKQTYDNLEINILDNGSTDKTKEIIIADTRAAAPCCDFLISSNIN